MQIKILGSGCKKCRSLESNTKAAAQSIGVDIDIEKITDIVEIARLGVMSTPGLMINNQVVSTGKVVPEREIRRLLQQANQED